MTRLANLSYADFEDLCRDIAQEETGLRFSAFGPGPDGGVDGRHSSGRNATIIQCKHYLKSPFSRLRKIIEDEMVKVKKLNPKRYLLYISQSLTPKKFDQLKKVLDNSLECACEIFGQEDIEASLKRFPNIEKSHIKLWLSSTAVLERILHSGIEVFSNMTKEEILDDLRVYVHNRSLDDALKILEKHRVLIISGPPGVGKTTLARIIAYHYLQRNWNFFAINSLEDGFAKIDRSTNTIFYFDDFLGRIALDRQALLRKESALFSFLNLVSRSKNTRFILTTRAHIFEEARSISDYIDDKKLQFSKYILNVEAYTRRVRSHILFNHLTVSNLSSDHYASLLQGDVLKKIIDHRNYNPRVIASISSACIEKVEPERYPHFILKALENPETIWAKPFAALPMRSQNLLICLYFFSETGVDVPQLTPAYWAMHSAVSDHFSQPRKIDDFEKALRSLESGFITISDQLVDFVNPSLRDYLKAYLVDIGFIRLLPNCATEIIWCHNLWNHVKTVFSSQPETCQMIASKFSSNYNRYIWDVGENKSTFDPTPFVSRKVLPFAEKIGLLLEWSNLSGNDDLVDYACKLLNIRPLNPWNHDEGLSMIKLHVWIEESVCSGYKKKKQLQEAVCDRLIEVVESGISIEELLHILEGISANFGESFRAKVKGCLDAAIEQEFDDIENCTSHLDTSGELEQHKESIGQLAEIAGRVPDDAYAYLDERILECEELEHMEPDFDYREYSNEMADRFGDAEVKNLFATLLNS